LEVLVQEVIGGDHHRPVVELHGLLPESDLDRAAWPGGQAGVLAERRGTVAVPVAGDRDGVGCRERLGAGLVQAGRRPGRGVLAKHRAERLRRPGQRDPVLRPFRPGDRRNYRGQVQVQDA
jgi:hypothetical protein